MKRRDVGEYSPKSGITSAQMEMLRKLNRAGGTLPVDPTKPFTVGALVRKGLIRGDARGRVVLTNRGKAVMK
mgnify:FL=1